MKINIAESHPFLKGKKLDNSDDTPPFSIQFNKKDASKQEEDNTFYFDENNTNFELNPFGDWPDDEPSQQTPPPSPTKIEHKIQFTNCSGEYADFNNLRLGIKPSEIKYFKRWLYTKSHQKIWKTEINY